MPTYNIHQAKTHLSRLLNDVAAGKEVVIARSGTPVAKLVSVANEGGGRRRRLGLFAGRMTVPDGFDAPLPDDVLRSFEEGDPVNPPLADDPA
jgi:prevent-host-death family protein